MTAFGVHIRLCNESADSNGQSTKLRLYFAFIPSKNQNNESNE